MRNSGLITMSKIRHCEKFSSISDIDMVNELTLRQGLTYKNAIK